MNASDIIIHDKEKVDLNDIFLNSESEATLNQLIREYKYRDELRKYNLPVDNKLLLHGTSGCGKTTTAKAIANA